MNLTKSMLIALRGRRGLDENDTSQDALILKMSPAQIVHECTVWYLGDAEWASTIALWMLKAEATPQNVYYY